MIDFWDHMVRARGQAPMKMKGNFDRTNNVRTDEVIDFDYTCPGQLRGRRVVCDPQVPRRERPSGPPYVPL